MKISVITPTIRPKSLSVTRETLMNQTLKDFEWLVDINITGEHDLNASFNKLIKRSKGELIVFLEDYIKIPEDALEKIWSLYEKDKCLTFPVGKVKDWEDKPTWDWRIHTDKCSWNNCELDFGAIPKDILYAVGGFDERLDQWWSMDNVSLGKRIHLLGYKFECVPELRGVAYDHDSFMEHPFRNRYNPDEVNQLLNSYESNPRLNYL